MRLLMLDNEFPPLGGGTGVVNYHLLQELAREPRLWVDLVTSSRTRDVYETERFSDRITIYKVPVDNRNIHHSSNRELLTYTTRGLALSLRLARRARYDCSFAFSTVPAGAISYALKIAASLPYLVSLQGPDVPGFEARYARLYPFLKPGIKAIWRAAAVVTAISRQHRELAQQTLPGLDMPVVFNGVETGVFRPSSEPRGGVVNVLCVGRLIERKGQHHLMHAFARLRQRYPDLNLRLTLAGTGDAEDQLKDLSAALSIDAAVQFLGCVKRADMPDIYRDAHIFVLPSQSEGMSIALLEALASGLPVIVTDTGGTDELIRPGVNGLVVKWADREGLTDALGLLVQNAGLRRRMGQAGRQVALGFSWPEIAAQYLSLLDKIEPARLPGTGRGRPAELRLRRNTP